MHTRNRADAEDITQDVFLSLLNPPAFNSEEHVKAWILRATMNRCKNAARSKRRNQAVPLNTYRTT
ncbi:MAG: sigma-70 family RNA polymerase sigma factor [Firmicutes bacterium]|nr:sigma-70 family RNA polymerase sigma factor [Bacillota bacterium]